MSWGVPSDAPDVGHAMLEVRLDGTGTVVSARVLDASSDASRWAEVATEIVKAARARPSKVSRDAQGYLLKLEVTSAIGSASGRTPTDAALTKVWRAINDPVDAVIVMAAAYSDEVAGLLRQHYGPHIHIAILRDFGLETVV